MSDTASWSIGALGEAQRKNPQSLRSVLFGLAFVLVLGFCGGTWVYLQETLSISHLLAQPRAGDWANTLSNLETLQRWSLGALFGAAAGGAGFLVAILRGAMASRRSLKHQIQSREAEWRCRQTEFQAQMMQLRRANDDCLAKQAELEERNRTLTNTNAALQEAINKRNRAERVLAQRKQELESSKSVLEMHVEARTQQLQQLQHRYEMILNSAGEGICGLDAEGRATFVNPAVARLTGWKIEELLGRTEHEIFPHQGASASSGRDAGEQIFQRKDGSTFPVECVRTDIDQDGKVVGAVLVFKDITERRRAESTLAQRAAELTRSNAELEQFAFVASHDLQEPLRKIQAFGDRLKLKCADILPAESQDYLERMQSAAARMRTLISDLLAFSRAIRSTEPFVPVELGVVAREVIGDLEVRIEKSGAKVEVGELPTIEADPLQMRQLLLNLIGNALKFQVPDAKPEVKIQGRVLKSVADEECAEITVQDNGIGFDEKYLDRIFAVFQRLHGRNEYEGTGVGLAVCRRIVDRHHGTINARSQPGKGASFIVTLPTCQSKN